MNSGCGGSIPWQPHYQEGITETLPGCLIGTWETVPEYRDCQGTLSPRRAPGKIPPVARFRQALNLYATEDALRYTGSFFQAHSRMAQRLHHRWCPVLHAIGGPGRMPESAWAGFQDLLHEADYAESEQPISL